MPARYFGADNFLDVIDYDNLATLLGTAQIGDTVAPSQQAWTSPGTYNFTVPDNVTSITILCVGAGGGAGGTGGTGTGKTGGGGGALYYANNVSVTAGETLTVVAGAGGTGGVSNGLGGAGGDSYVRRGVTDLCLAEGGEGGNNWNVAAAGGNTSNCVGDGGGSGGTSLASTSSQVSAGGGGAGGYSGNGGDGVGTAADGFAGAGGAGGGGARINGGSAGGGGGVGLLGEGASGAGGTQTATTNGGGGGSGGTDGGDGNSAGVLQPGGLYGGGAGSPDDSFSTDGGAGGNGAVRILWGGNRSFPSTNTGDDEGDPILIAGTVVSNPSSPLTGILDSDISISVDSDYKRYDINNDGLADSADGTLLSQYYANGYSLSGINSDAGVWIETYVIPHIPIQKYYRPNYDILSEIKDNGFWDSDDSRMNMGPGVGIGYTDPITKEVKSGVSGQLLTSNGSNSGPYWGLILKHGTIPVSTISESTTPAPVVFDEPFPNNLYGIQTTIKSAEGTVMDAFEAYIQEDSAGGFKWKVASQEGQTHEAGVYWLAYGD